jgi:FMN phosphatase YigB (HAD superfamily)
VITDVDNTLYDWLNFYIPSFLAMVEEIHRISGVDVSSLKRSFRRVHQAHGTSEYAFAIQELDVLQAIDAGLSPNERLEKYDSAIHAFRSSRKRTLRLYPGVKETLQRLRDAGVMVVAHSDSMMSYTSRRLRQLGIDGLLTAVSAARDHGVPTSLDLGSVRRVPASMVESRTVHLEFSPGIRKPDPATVTPVLVALSVPREEALYVGDSLSRDVLLARRAGIADVWARYGSRRDEALYRELLEITYWTETEVTEEERLRKEIGGSGVSNAIDSFSELLPLAGIA